MQMCAVACSAMVTVGTYYGLGRSMDSIGDPSDVSKAIKYTVISQALLFSSTAFGKLSAVVFLVRLKGMAAQRWHLVVIWAVCSIMLATNVLGIIFTAGYCYPAAKQWDASLEGWCMSLRLQYGTEHPPPPSHFISPWPTFNFVHSLRSGPFQSCHWLLHHRLPCFNGYDYCNISCVLDTETEHQPHHQVRFVYTNGRWLAVRTSQSSYNCTLAKKFTDCVRLSSAAAATIVKMCYLGGLLSKNADFTSAWAPIVLWYT